MAVTIAVVHHRVIVVLVVVLRVDACLAAVVAGNRQLVGPLAAEPRIKEADGICLIVSGVGLCGDGECLPHPAESGLCRSTDTADSL